MKYSKRVKIIWISFYLILAGLIIIGGTIYFASKNVSITEHYQTVEKNITTTSKKKSINSRKEIPQLDTEKNNSENKQIAAIILHSYAELSLVYIIFLSVGSIIYASGLVLFIYSKFGKKDIFKQRRKVYVYVLTSLLVSMILSFAMIKLTEYYILNKASVPTVIDEHNAKKIDQIK